MITVARLGRRLGLGNHLFKYAMLLGVAERRGFTIAIGPGVLDGFRVSAAREPFEVLDRLPNTFRERGAVFRFDPSVLDQSDDTRYGGYFQSYRYFGHAVKRVRKELEFQEGIRSEAIREFASICRIARGRETVFVSARRGDYVNVPLRFNAFTTEYFEQARKAVPSGSLFVVSSDDLPWVMTHYQGPDFYFVQQKDRRICMCVGTLCDHYICSAGTFAWWTAWLGHTNRSCVVIPTPWFGPAYEFPEADNEMSPPEWIRICPIM